MSRVIKFRAWNGEEISHSDECNSLEHFFACYSDGFGGYQPAIMQFTGLHDVNGVEIYEGDIVECDEHFYYEISWSEKYHAWNASECGGLTDLPKEIKVIGNIHQNPELLESAK